MSQLYRLYVLITILSMSVGVAVWEAVSHARHLEYDAKYAIAVIVTLLGFLVRLNNKKTN